MEEKEIIIVNDGSDDQSSLIFSIYLRVLIINQKILDYLQQEILAQKKQKEGFFLS